MIALGLRRGWWLAAVLGALVGPGPAAAQDAAILIEPVFSIWDVRLGEPIDQIPKENVGEIACGTNGGPPSTALIVFSDFTKCAPEQSGLREVYFTYDDEQDYIARAMEKEFKFLQGGTSVYAHASVLSVLVDDSGIVRGIRIVTDNRASETQRRSAFNLASNLKARFQTWSFDCEDIPPQPGEQPVGNRFVHEICSASDGETGDLLRMESSYLRKRGQAAVNPETQKVNSTYYQSITRFEIVEPPYEPDTTPAR